MKRSLGRAVCGLVLMATAITATTSVALAEDSASSDATAAPATAPTAPTAATSTDVHGAHSVHTESVAGSGWVMRASESVNASAPRTRATYSFFDPARMNDPNWGASRIGFFVECNSVGHQQVDAIVSPGRPSAHLHEFFGSRVVTSNLTTQQLVDEPSTRIECSDTNDKSSYWSPAVYQDGRLVTATGFKAYYKSPTPNVVPIPLGLRMIAGDGAARANQDRHIGAWVGAGDAFNEITTIGSNRMITKPRGSEGIALRINYPQCWDGVHLDSPDHKSHMAYARSNRCPSTHPVRLPQLVTFAEYNVEGGAGLKLSSGEWFTFHQDFWNGWSPAQMKDLVSSCITEQMMCRTRTTPALVRLGQYVATVPAI